MSMELHVFLRGKLPNKSALQKAMRELGFPLTIRPATGSLEKQKGYMPVMIGREDESGVELDIFEGRAAVEEHVHDVDPRFDRCANFRWGSDAQEMVVAFCCAAALAKLVDGVVFDAEDGRLLSVDEALATARETLAVVCKPEERRHPGTRPSDIKRYLKPLLAMRKDLVLRGRLLLISPVRHVLRGAFFDRTSDKYQFQIWRHISPLYDKLYDIGDGDSLYMTVWQPYFEPSLLDTLDQDVLDRVARLASLADFADQIAETGPFMKVRAKALILAGERDRAAACIEEYERLLPRDAVFWNIAEERALLDRDIRSVCEEHHRLEAESAKALKLGDAWEPTPFAAELPAASRAKANEPAFAKTPWIARQDWLLGEPPGRVGDVLFSKSAVWRKGRIVPLVPITGAEAQERHERYDEYCLFTLIAEGALLMLHYPGNTSPHDPDPIRYNEFGRTRTHFQVSVNKPSGQLVARCCELFEARGTVALQSMDWSDNAPKGRRWHVWIDDRERTFSYHERPPNPARDQRRAMSDEEAGLCRIAVPAFGAFDMLLERMNACLAFMDLASERVALAPRVF